MDVSGRWRSGNESKSKRHKPATSCFVVSRRTAKTEQPTCQNEGVGHPPFCLHIARQVAMLHDMISPVCCDHSEPMENTSPQSVLGKRPRDQASDQTPQESSKLFQCGDCRKSYSRVDHLARHVRLHTKVSVGLRVSCDVLLKHCH